MKKPLLLAGIIMQGINLLIGLSFLIIKYDWDGTFVLKAIGYSLFLLYNIASIILIIVGALTD